MTAGTKIMLAAVAMLLPCGAAWAGGTPAALVVDYWGFSNLRIKAFSELADGAVVRLGDKERMTLLHYRTCKQFTVTGGQIAVSALAIDAHGGQMAEDQGGACPQEIDFDSPGAAPQAIKSSLNCVMVGTGAAAIGGVEVMEGERLVQSIPVQGNRVISAPAAAAFSPGRAYTLVLKGIDGAVRDRIMVDVAAGTGGGANGGTCLIRID